jgi:ABC-type protease/lipase transport system fused ATPase/permease subunit
MIQQLPNGYDTQIGDGGLTLSGGQRQRIALARALFGLPALIVLDEPNASLDSQGETALIEAIQALKRAKRTVIFVTHKVNLLGTADKVAVMNQGQVQLFGDRDEILAKLFGGPRAVAPVSAQAVG